MALSCCWEISILFWSLSEKNGGRDFGSSHGNFVDLVHSNALVDLGFVGNKFT